jgi:hypothetical protein
LAVWEFEGVIKFGSNIPMKRQVQPDEIASAYVVLTSAHCSCNIMRQIVPIIGGYGRG